MIKYPKSKTNINNYLKSLLGLARYVNQVKIISLLISILIVIELKNSIYITLSLPMGLLFGVIIYETLKGIVFYMSHDFLSKEYENINKDEVPTSSKEDE